MAGRDCLDRGAILTTKYTKHTKGMSCCTIIHCKKKASKA